MPRPDECPTYRASVALARLLWLTLPIERRRECWAIAEHQMGVLSGIPGWIETRAQRIAGISRASLAKLVTEPDQAAALLDRIGHLLASDPLGVGDCPCGAIGGQDGQIGDPGASVAPAAIQGR